MYLTSYPQTVDFKYVDMMSYIQKKVVDHTCVLHGLLFSFSNALVGIKFTECTHIYIQYIFHTVCIKTKFRFDCKVLLVKSNIVQYVTVAIFLCGICHPPNQDALSLYFLFILFLNKPYLIYKYS